MATFPERLQFLRKDRDLTRKALSDLTGISHSSLNMYERGEREPGLQTLELLADFFNVDMDYLMGRQKIERKVDVIQNAITSIADEADEADTDDTELPFAVCPLLKSVYYGDLNRSKYNIERYVNTDIEVDERPQGFYTSYFALYAKDDSMMGMGIYTGDILVFDTDVNNLWLCDGNIVLVAMNNRQEAILRRLIMQENGLIILEAQNANFRSKSFTYEEFEDNVQVIARLLRVEKKLLVKNKTF